MKFDGCLSISPPLKKKDVDEANTLMENLLKKGEDSVGIRLFRPCGYTQGFRISDDGKNVIYLKTDYDYNCDRYLKYLIEHGIKSKDSCVNGEMVFLDCLADFGILGVANNKVYKKQYLCDISLHNFLNKKRNKVKIKDVPRKIDNEEYIPIIYSYNIAKKITRNTTFEGSFKIHNTRKVRLFIYDLWGNIKNGEIYQKTRLPKKSIEDDPIKKWFEFLPWDDEVRQDEMICDLEDRRNRKDVYPKFNEINDDGTLGDFSENSEWILSDKENELYWSGKAFIAAHSWLAYLVHNIFECSGSVKWKNEHNEEGKLIVEAHVSDGVCRQNFVFIEYEGTKYLANIP